MTRSSCEDQQNIIRPIDRLAFIWNDQIFFSVALFFVFPMGPWYTKIWLHANFQRESRKTELRKCIRLSRSTLNRMSSWYLPYLLVTVFGVWSGTLAGSKTRHSSSSSMRCLYPSVLHLNRLASHSRFGHKKIREFRLRLCFCTVHYNNKRVRRFGTALMFWGQTTSK